MEYLVIRKEDWKPHGRLSSLAASLRTSGKPYIALYDSAKEERRPVLTALLISKDAMSRLNKASKPNWWGNAREFIKRQGFSEFDLKPENIHSIGFIDDKLTEYYCKTLKINISDFRVDTYPTGYTVLLKKF